MHLVSTSFSTISLLLIFYLWWSTFSQVSVFVGSHATTSRVLNLATVLASFCLLQFKSLEVSLEMAKNMTCQKLGEIVYPSVFTTYPWSSDDASSFFQFFCHLFIVYLWLSTCSQVFVFAASYTAAPLVLNLATILASFCQLQLKSVEVSLEVPTISEKLGDLLLPANFFKVSYLIIQR